MHNNCTCFSWCFTFLGTVELARKHKCSLRQALDNKVFSASHWEWNHRFLIDANKQDGYPTAFFTFSPCEWNFPLVCTVFLNIYTLGHTLMILNCLFMIILLWYYFPMILLPLLHFQIRWLSDKQYMTSSNIQNLPTNITMHLLHILEQYICGYLTGVHSNCWQKHVLADTKYELIYIIFLSFLLCNSFYLWFKFNHTVSFYLKQKRNFFALILAILDIKETTLIVTSTDSKIRVNTLYIPMFWSG